MENNALQEMSVELLELEERWRKLLQTKEKSLPDVAAAKKRIAQAKVGRVLCIICAVIVLALFFVGRPRVAAYREAMMAEYGFSMMPTVVKLLLWLGIIVFAVCALYFFAHSIPDKSDVNVQETYAASKKFNDQLAEDRQSVQKEHKELVEKLNQMAGTRLGDENPRYFFQIPFDPDKTWESYKAGMEFYSEAFMKTDLVEPFGYTRIGTAPVIHKPKDRRYLHFDGFYSLKNCTVSEALSLLEKEKYTILFQDEKYLREHPDDEVWLQCIWDTESRPVENQGYFKFREMELSDFLPDMTEKWTELEQFMGSGIPEYEPYVHVEKSSVKDVRAEYFHQKINPGMYGDVVDIKEGSGPFRLVNAKKTHFMQKGYLMFHDGDSRILYAALTDHPVYISRIDFNCSIYEWNKWSRFHGWIAGGSVSDRRVMPDKASTIEYLCNELNEYMPDFDAAAERPEGLTDGQYRLWAMDWYRATVWKRRKLEKKAQGK